MSTAVDDSFLRRLSDMERPTSSTDSVHERPKPPSTRKTYLYPYAASPDIIRSNQKDTYFEGILLENLTTILRRLYGSRFAHKWSSEARTFTELLYLGLTTFIGNRTLGEEYCDIYQVEDGKQKLPAIGRRAGYILSAVLLPYILGKIIPRIRSRVRLRLEKSQSQVAEASRDSVRYRLRSYILENLDTITSISTSPIYAISLAGFYFMGSFYHLSKRLFRLRYIFSKQIAPSEQRVGYEVLGVLLVLQMMVQSCLHIHNTMSASLPTEGSSAILDDGVEVARSAGHDHHDGQPIGVSSKQDTSRLRVSYTTHTPISTESQPRYDLADDSTLSWLQPKQQRKCTLCLEPMKDPSVTTCGHVFCWTCILDWVDEKPECPLCRQNVLGQHVLPLRG